MDRKQSNNRKQCALVSVSNDLVSDNRVDKICRSLQKRGYEVLLVGRKKRKSPPMNERPYAYKRMNLFFERGVFFYAEINLRLLFKILSTKCSLLWANDLDVLSANYVAKKIKGIELIYDSHEFFTEIPELNHRPFVKRCWKTVEKIILPHLHHVVTVCDPIASYFSSRYNINASIVRNIPSQELSGTKKSRKDLGMPEGNVLIWQGGGCNIDRGLEELIDAMPEIEAHLYIIGGGDVYEALQAQASLRGVLNKITFVRTIPFQELMQYTSNSTLGICIDKPTNQNYLISLPNKLFDYIRAEIPILISDLPEIKKVLCQYDVGTFLKSYNPSEMAKQINSLLANPDKLASYQPQLKKASSELTWENEEKEIFAILDKIEAAK